MKLVQTLVVRDEADIVDDQIAYHLNAGVDFVIASDHESTRRHDRDSRVVRPRRCPPPDPVHGEMRDGPWRTRMARLAATEHGADWVINTDADEFWMPDGRRSRRSSRRPGAAGIVFALSRHFVPRPDDGAVLRRAHDLRVSPAVAINDPTSPYRPHLKAAHRADAEVTISHGAHTAYSRAGVASSLASRRGPALPVSIDVVNGRTRRSSMRVATARSASTSQALLARSEARSADRYAALVVDDLVAEREGARHGVSHHRRAASRCAACRRGTGETRRARGRCAQDWCRTRLQRATRMSSVCSVPRRLERAGGSARRRRATNRR